MSKDGSTVTIVGRAATNPVVSSPNGVDRVTFRIVSTERRQEDGVWIDGDEFGTNVVCWRGVAAGVLRLVRKGDPLVVQGRISTRKYERNGVVEYYTDVRGDLVAFDVNKGKDRVRRAESDGADTAEPARTEASGGAAGSAGSHRPLDDELDPLPDLADAPSRGALAGVG